MPIFSQKKLHKLCKCIYNKSYEKKLELYSFWLYVFSLSRKTGGYDSTNFPVFANILSDWCQFIIPETQTQKISLTENLNYSSSRYVLEKYTASKLKCVWNYFNWQDEHIVKLKSSLKIYNFTKTDAGNIQMSIPLQFWALSTKLVVIWWSAKFYPIPDHCTLRCDQNYARPI